MTTPLFVAIHSSVPEPLTRSHTSSRNAYPLQENSQSHPPYHTMKKKSESNFIDPSI